MWICVPITGGPGQCGSVYPLQVVQGSVDLCTHYRWSRTVWICVPITGGPGQCGCVYPLQVVQGSVDLCAHYMWSRAVWFCVPITGGPGQCGSECPLQMVQGSVDLCAHYRCSRAVWICVPITGGPAPWDYIVIISCIYVLVLLVNSYSTLLILELIYCVICCWSFICLSVQCPCAVTCLLLKFFIKL